MPADHFATVRRFVTQAEEETKALRLRLSRQDTELHTARRQVERYREQNARLEARVAQLEAEVERNASVARSAQRAMMNHAGRIT
jgi:predicted RNase H-like nuclease (RuvC/YqgF family)